MHRVSLRAECAELVGDERVARQQSTLDVPTCTEVVAADEADDGEDGGAMASSANTDPGAK